MVNRNIPAETQTQHLWRLIGWLTLANEDDDHDDNNNDIIMEIIE
jgi:hypothetical protein